MTHRTTAAGVGPVLTAAIHSGTARLAAALAVVRGGDMAALRHARVATRRLRELLTLVGQMHRGLPADRAVRHLRRVTRALGPLRELDVARSELERAMRRHGWTDARMLPVRRWLEKEGQGRTSKLLACVKLRDSRRLGDLLTQTADRLASAGAGRAWADVLMARLLRRLRAVHVAADACGTLYASERLHALRIALKKLRYVLEVAQQTSSCPAAAPILILKGLQTTYGRLHDVEVLARLVGEAAAVGRGASLRVSAQIVVDALERDCRELHAAALEHRASLDPLLSDVRRALAGIAPGRRRPAVSAIPRALETTRRARSVAS